MTGRHEIHRAFTAVCAALCYALCAALCYALCAALAPIPDARASTYSITPVGQLGFSNLAAGSAANAPYLSIGTSVGGGMLASLIRATHRDYEWELGLLYSPRKVSVDTPSGEHIDTKTFDAIEAPLTVHYNGVDYLSFGFGGYYAYLTHAGQDISRHDVGIVATGGGRVSVSSSMQLLLDVRAMLGVLNLNQGPPEAGTLRNRALEILTGIKLIL